MARILFVNGLNRFYPDPRISDDMLKSMQYHDLKGTLHKAMSERSTLVLSPMQFLDCPAVYDLMIAEDAPMKAPALVNAGLLCLTRPEAETLRAMRDAICSATHPSRLKAFFDPHDNEVGAVRMNRIGMRMASIAEQMDNMTNLYIDERGLTDRDTPTMTPQLAATHLIKVLAPRSTAKQAYITGLDHLSSSTDMHHVINAVHTDSRCAGHTHVALDAIADALDYCDRHNTQNSSVAISAEKIIAQRFPTRTPAKAPYTPEQRPFDLDFGIA